MLLHGLGRTRFSMLLPQRRLAAAGFAVLNVQYPSRTRPIQQLADEVRRRLGEQLPEPCGAVHFLTHSLGGVVVRVLLAGAERAFRLGRVVMLAPPNQGSQIADRLGDGWWFRAALGPAGQELRAGDDSLPRRLGPPDYDVGVIAGTRPATPWAGWIAGPSDGTVTVDETRLDGMSDFLQVPRGHTFLMNDPAVLDQAVHFFRHGRFEHRSRG